MKKCPKDHKKQQGRCVKSNRSSAIIAVAVVVPVVAIAAVVTLVLCLRKKRNATRNLGKSKVAQSTLRLKTPSLDGDVAEQNGKLTGDDVPTPQNVKPLVHKPNVQHVRVKNLKPILTQSK